MHFVPLGATLLIDVHLMVVGADGDLCGETDMSLRRQQRGQPPSPPLLSTRRVLFKSQAVLCLKPLMSCWATPVPSTQIPPQQSQDPGASLHPRALC